MAFYVFDLDGTLADCAHRIHHITGPEKDWTAFFAACVDDKPIRHTLDLFIRLNRTDRCEIWSGRSDEVATDTNRWLLRHAGYVPRHVRMRKAGDHRPDDVIKREFLAEYGRPDIVFEDRARVVEMWRAEGIPCFQVDAGDF